MPHHTSEKMGLSADEFKDRMYGHLKKKGHLDALKTQLRYKIVEELRGASVIRFPSETLDENQATFKLVNSLVSDHLRRNQYDYTLSVFLAESGTGQNKVRFASSNKALAFENMNFLCSQVHSYY